MKKILILVIVILSIVSNASADMIAKGVCNASSRDGWQLSADKIDIASEQINVEGAGEWYSHISCAETYGEITVSFAVTLKNGDILSENEVFEYLDDLFFSELSIKEIIRYDAENYGIIEGVFDGEDQIEEAVALTVKIHDEKEAK